eukprot:2080274-Amphidinium_carterae.1
MWVKLLTGIENPYFGKAALNIDKPRIAVSASLSNKTEHWNNGHNCPSRLHSKCHNDPTVREAWTDRQSSKSEQFIGAALQKQTFICNKD